MVLLKTWRDLRDWFIEEGCCSESNNYPDGKILNMRKIAVVTGTRAEYGLLYLKKLLLLITEQFNKITT